MKIAPPGAGREHQSSPFRFFLLSAGTVPLFPDTWWMCSRMGAASSPGSHFPAIARQNIYGSRAGAVNAPLMQASSE